MGELRRILITVVCCFAVGYASAQPTTDDPVPGGGKPGSNPAPISGIEILIGLGGLLGAKKLFDARKKNQELP